MAPGSANRFFLALIAIAVALGVGTMVGLGVVLIQEEPSAPDPTRPPSLRELGGEGDLAVVANGDGTTVHGPVGFDTDAIRADDTLVLYGPDGREELGQGHHADLAPDDRPDGLYRIQVERETGDGTVVVSERTFEVRTPSDPSDVAWAAAIGAAFSAAASVLGGVAASQAGVMVQVAQESLIGFGESKLKDAEEKRKAKMGIGTVRRKRTKAQVRRAVIIAVSITVLLMAVFFTFEEMDAVTGSEFFAKLPLVAPIAGAMAILAFGSEWLLALATGTVARFKVLWSGALTLILSSTIFRTAFGFPGYVDEDHGDGEKLPQHVEGMRGIASMAAFPAILLPFVILGWQRFDIVAVAMNVGLAGLAAVSMPFRPMPGNDVWRWNRLASVAFWIGAFVLFFGFELGFMSLWEFTIVGIVSLFTLLGTAAWLYIRRQEPGWYRDMLDAIQVTASRTPKWMRRLGGALAFVPRVIDAWLGTVGDVAAAAGKRIAEPIATYRQVREMRKGIEMARAAFEAAGPEVDHVSIVNSSNVGITVSRHELEDAQLAQQLAAIMKSLPRDVERITLLDPADGSSRVVSRV